MKVKSGSQKHNRSSIRLKGYDYSQAGGYFVTVCTQDRKCLLGKVVNRKSKLNEFGKIVESVWLDLPKHHRHIELDSFVVMPNPVHGVIIIVGAGLKPAPTKNRHPLPEIVPSFKTFSSRRINQMRVTPGVTVWRRNYYENIIRNEDELNRIREYIIDNALQGQFDRENPEQVQDKSYYNKWSHFEESIYGKTK
jgi:REP element-mobilizing transposase RayT